MCVDLYSTKARQSPSSDMAAFREQFAKAKHIVVLTGAGVSAESGVPTFRGAGGFWRKYQAQVNKENEKNKLRGKSILLFFSLRVKDWK